MTAMRSRLVKDLESFDKLRTNGKSCKMIERIPFMLRFSKHETSFFNNMLKSRSPCRPNT
jgi:hypothetical protein